jgi:hypothetical protein
MQVFLRSLNNKFEFYKFTGDVTVEDNKESEKEKSQSVSIEQQ